MGGGGIEGVGEEAWVRAGHPGALSTWLVPMLLGHTTSSVDCLVACRAKGMWREGLCMCVGNSVCEGKHPVCVGEEDPVCV